MINPQQWQRHVEDSKDLFFKGYPDLFRAFEFSVNYSVFYNSLIESKLTEASREVLGMDSPSGVALFSFGAPARKEMFGGSDADVAVYRAGNTNQELKLRDKFVELLQDFNFTKIDTPVWGTLDDIQRYMSTSVTEANQVMEAQFICGDPEFRKRVESLRISLYDKDIIARNLIFQFFYFDQYYGKKASPGHLNLKYCAGGIRDFLFPMWYAQLKAGIDGNLKTTAMERGLTILYEERLLSQDDIVDIMKHSSSMAFIRDEVIRLTPGDMDGKITPQKSLEICKKRPSIFKNNQDIMGLVERSRRKVISAKAKVWEGLGQYFATTKPEGWNAYFKKALARENCELPSEFEHDEVINTAKIWNLNAQSAEESSDYIEKISGGDSWIVLASLLSSPHVSGSIIDSIIKRKGLTPGYEYLLEIAARNPNLKNDTLEFILNDDSTEQRFKKPALELAGRLKL
ncbi:hypothetical protein HYU22_05665 [Candidatus Woesearchaeota archaeon]|nr:hypothetical protein [Candidatus Woesearchaeota archaeon]